MAEPNFGQDSRSAEASSAANRESASDAVPNTASGAELPKRSIELPPIPATPAEGVTASLSDSCKQHTAMELDRQRRLWEQEHTALLTELMQLRSLTQEQIDRIRNLEQALDQSLASLSELRLQVVSQQILETQLASTEEISNIQQQAISRLKQQLAQQQQLLDTQLSEAQQRDQSVQDMLTMMEMLTQTQQTELERLRAQIARDRLAVQSHRSRLEKQLAELHTALSAQQQRVVELESQSLSARVLEASLDLWLVQAQAQVKELAEQFQEQFHEGVVPHLENCRTILAELDAKLKQAHGALQEQSIRESGRGEGLLNDELLNGELLSSESAIQPDEPSQPVPEADLETAQAKIEALETQIAKQSTTQAMLQHACQELEAERDRQQQRIAELEQQTADMQEQILRQAQQASEYETAVQHWKDRYINSRDQMQRLKQGLEQLPNPPAEVLEMLELLQETATTFTEPSSPALLSTPSTNPSGRIDLPEFLMRRRSYKARRS